MAMIALPTIIAGAAVLIRGAALVLAIACMIKYLRS